MFPCQPRSQLLFTFPQVAVKWFAHGGILAGIAEWGIVNCELGMVNCEWEVVVQATL